MFNVFGVLGEGLANIGKSIAGAVSSGATKVYNFFNPDQNPNNILPDNNSGINVNYTEKDGYLDINEGIDVNYSSEKGFEHIDAYKNDLYHNPSEIKGYVETKKAEPYTYVTPSGHTATVKFYDTPVSVNNRLENKLVFSDTRAEYIANGFNLNNAQRENPGQELLNFRNSFGSASEAKAELRSMIEWGEIEKVNGKYIVAN